MYSSSRQCTCVLKTYWSLYLIDAIKERARKYRCKQKRTLPKPYCCRKVIEEEDNMNDEECNGDSNWLLGFCFKLLIEGIQKFKVSWLYSGFLWQTLCSQLAGRRENWSWKRFLKALSKHLQEMLQLRLLAILPLKKNMVVLRKFLHLPWYFSTC